MISMSNNINKTSILNKKVDIIRGHKNIKQLLLKTIKKDLINA